MFVVGLTGGIGSGKSTVTNIFASLGVPIVDVDVISHQLTTTGGELIPVIKQAFGKDFINIDGALNREKMRQLVFNNPPSRLQLEAILHPAIHAEALLQLAHNVSAPYQILAIPLLAKNSPYQRSIHRVLVIDSDESSQISRTMQRSGLTEQDIRNIMSAQISREERLALANDVITNDGDFDDLRIKIVGIHKKYINTCIVSK